MRFPDRIWSGAVAFLHPMNDLNAAAEKMGQAPALDAGLRPISTVTVVAVVQNRH